MNIASLIELLVNKSFIKIICLTTFFLFLLIKFSRLLLINIVTNGNSNTNADNEEPPTTSQSWWIWVFLYPAHLTIFIRTTNSCHVEPHPEFTLVPSYILRSCGWDWTKFEVVASVFLSASHHTLWKCFIKECLNFGHWEVCSFVFGQNTCTENLRESVSNIIARVLGINLTQNANYYHTKFFQHLSQGYFYCK